MLLFKWSSCERLSWISAYIKSSYIPIGLKTIISKEQVYKQTILSNLYIQMFVSKLKVSNNNGFTLILDRTNWGILPILLLATNFEASLSSVAWSSAHDSDLPILIMDLGGHFPILCFPNDMTELFLCIRVSMSVWLFYPPSPLYLRLSLPHLCSSLFLYVCLYACLTVSIPNNRWDKIVLYFEYSI